MGISGSALITALSQSRGAYNQGKQEAQQAGKKDQLSQILMMRKMQQEDDAARLAQALGGANVQKIGAETDKLRNAPGPRNPVEDANAQWQYRVDHPAPHTTADDNSVVPVVRAGKNVYERRSAAVGQEAPHADPKDHFSAVTIQPEGEKPVVQTYNTSSGAAGPVIGAAKEQGGQGAASLKTKVGSNRAALKAIQDAIADVKAHPDAFGLSRGIPIVGDAINQRLDPSGVGPRAKVANIGSQKMHDRSGAAVTAKEMPRLAPFIPGGSDTPEAIVTKLTEMAKILDQETGELEKVGNIPSGNIDLRTPSRAQQLWDAAVAKHGKAKVEQMYGPRP